MAELFGTLGETKALFLAADTDPVHRANVTITAGTAMKAGTILTAGEGGTYAAAKGNGTAILAADVDETATVANVYISGAFIAEHLIAADGDTVDANADTLYAHNIRIVHEN